MINVVDFKRSTVEATESGVVYNYTIQADSKTGKRYFLTLVKLDNGQVVTARIDDEHVRLGERVEMVGRKQASEANGAVVYGYRFRRLNAI